MAAGIELNLPDLPEVPIQLGPVRAGQPTGRVHVRRAWRLREALTAYLPLLLMVGLALGTWWLVKNSPGPLPTREAAAPRAEPDYVMTGFLVQRFDPDGRLQVQLQGQQMRHFPDSDRIEIDGVSVRSWAPDGRESQATARRAVAKGDGSELRLEGAAQVRGLTPSGEPIEIDSEFLQFFTRTERVLTEQAVTVRAGANQVRAARLQFDNLKGLLELGGPVRASLRPQGAAAAKGPNGTPP